MRIPLCGILDHFRTLNVTVPQSSPTLHLITTRGYDTRHYPPPPPKPSPAEIQHFEAFTEAQSRNTDRVEPAFDMEMKVQTFLPHDNKTMN
jgi:hypothetical protein